MNADEFAFKQLIFADEFLISLASIRKMSAHTVRAYESDLSSFELWCQTGNHRIKKTTYRDLRNYLAQLHGGQYSKATIARKMATLRSYFSYLCEQDILHENPADLLVTPKMDKRLPKAMPASEVEALLTAPDTDTAVGMRDSALLECLYATGARVSEISSSTISQLRVNEATLRVIGKGDKERLLPLYPLAIQKLESYLNGARSELLHGQNHDQIFISTRGNPLSASAIREIIKRYVKQTGIQTEVTPHSFRHTYATDLLSSGADLRSVQELLGHANLSTTQIYTHVSAVHLKDVHRRTHPRG